MNHLIDSKEEQEFKDLKSNIDLKDYSSKYTDISIKNENFVTKDQKYINTITRSQNNKIDKINHLMTTKIFKDHKNINVSIKQSDNLQINNDNLKSNSIIQKSKKQIKIIDINQFVTNLTDLDIDPLNMPCV